MATLLLISFNLSVFYHHSNVASFFLEPIIPSFAQDMCQFTNQSGAPTALPPENLRTSLNCG
jgi:hypothetical protein